jgi:hypothetical protein
VSSEEFGNKPKIRGILTAIAKNIAPNISALTVVLLIFLVQPKLYYDLRIQYQAIGL